MSTRFTQRGTPMAESHSLRLVQSATAVQEQITRHVAETLKARGYQDVSPSLLGFLGALDCGTNYGSEIARRLNVSRQMVAKTVKELVRLGYLEQADGPGKQKQILFTGAGEQLMSDVRQLLVEMDALLSQQVGKQTLERAVSLMENIQQSSDLTSDR